MINLKCPKCGQYMSVSESQAGRDEACPNCGNVNVIPYVSAPSAAPGQPPHPAAPVVDPQKRANTWAMWCHLAGLAWFISIPFAGVAAPLIIWLIKRDEHPFIESQGKESLNFQISLAIYTVVSTIMIFIFVGILLLLAIAVVNIVCVIAASKSASRGEAYVYPLTIRFVK